MFALTYRAGLRLQEALDLQPRDVDLDAGSINVREGKGTKQRMVGVDPGAVALLEQVPTNEDVNRYLAAGTKRYGYDFR